jgi:hypothetical protein
MFNNWYRSRKVPGPSASNYERKLSKLNLRIEKLALKGKDYYLDFSKLIDELVAKGEWSTFEQCLFYYYGIALDNISSIDSIKKSTWKEVCFQTNTSFLTKLKKFYDLNDVYQIGYDIYSNSRDFVQLDLSTPLTTTYSSTNFSNSFLIERNGDLIDMKVLDKNLHYVSIERADWIENNGVEIPTNQSYLQDFFLGTFSNQKNPEYPIQLEIPVDVSRDYVIFTEERQNVLKDFDLISSFTSSFGGTSSISWKTQDGVFGYLLNISTYSTFNSTIPDISVTGSFVTSPGGTYSFITWSTDERATSYIMNISTYSNFEISHPNYDDKIYGTTTSLPYYLVSGSVSYAYVFGLTPSSSYFWKVQKVSTGYSEILFGTISAPPFYTVNTTQSSFELSGLSSSTGYYYKLNNIFSYTQSFTSTAGGTGSIVWSVDPLATGYSVDISTYSTFDTFLPEFINHRLGTYSQLPSYFIVNGNSTTVGTASFYPTGLSASTDYYFRVRRLFGKFATLNYKLRLFKDPYLGKIIEVEIFTPDARYLVQNRQFASLVGARKTYLEVYKRNLSMPSGFATASIFAYDNLSYTEESNLLKRYIDAINYLNS